jgi:hypothetical protein
MHFSKICYTTISQTYVKRLALLLLRKLYKFNVEMLQRKTLMITSCLHQFENLPVKVYNIILSDLKNII